MKVLDTALGRMREQGLARAFRHRDYAIFITGHWVSNIGMWVQRVATGWLAWDLTHSGAWLGAIALAQALPILVLLPFSSTVVDRVDRLKLMRVTQIFSFVVTAAMAGLILADLMTIWWLMAGVILFGIGGAFSQPAGQTIAPNLVPREDLSAAIAVSSVLFGTAAFLGPAVAGLLIAKVGIAWAFMFNACSFLVQYGGIVLIRNFRHEHRRSERQGFFADLTDGLRYAAGHGGILPLLLLSVTASFLLRPLMDLLPGFVDVIFGHDASGFATLVAAFGVGGLIGALWIANRNKTDGIVTIFLFGSMMVAALSFVVATTDSFTVALVAMFFLGMVGSTATNSAQIGIQHAVDGAMRGRMMGLYALNFRAAPSLGSMLMGGLSAYLGLQIPVAAGAVLCLLAFAYALPRRRAIAAIVEAPQDTPAAEKASALRPSAPTGN